MSKASPQMEDRLGPPGSRFPRPRRNWAGTRIVRYPDRRIPDKLTHLCLPGGDRETSRAAQYPLGVFGRVARVMRGAGIAGCRRERLVKTTVADPATQKVPDLLDRDFTAAEPNTKYVGDIT
jgi:transposase InsO family protein